LALMPLTPVNSEVNMFLPPVVRGYPYAAEPQVTLFVMPPVGDSHPG
jgi:hypothetical protein